MILLTRLDGREIIVNADLIESIEESPDTILKFTTGRKMMVREKLKEVLARVMDYRKQFPMYAIPAGEEEKHGWEQSG
ncbi:MAG: flagellar FlbD family protein [Candidatus Krumholzibacteriota bacterium]|nr:flagellar FlbD family protein [Candidatus Krumholzibacteriota bacterium]